MRDKAFSQVATGTRTLFQSAYRRGQLSRLIAFLTRRPRSLYEFATVQHTCAIGHHDYIGTQFVAIRQIRGTGGRVRDFDIDFYPLRSRTAERWTDVANALKLGKRLPAVRLTQVEEIYFVQDGHHRISIALALGQDYIEAEVTSMEVGARLPGAVRQPHSPCPNVII